MDVIDSVDEKLSEFAYKLKNALDNKIRKNENRWEYDRDVEVAITIIEAFSAFKENLMYGDISDPNVIKQELIDRYNNEKEIANQNLNRAEKGTKEANYYMLNTIKFMRTVNELTKFNIIGIDYEA